MFIGNYLDRSTDTAPARQTPVHACAGRENIDEREILRPPYEILVTSYCKGVNDLFSVVSESEHKNGNSLHGAGRSRGWSRVTA